MEDIEVDLETIKGRAVKGVVTLTGRMFLLQIIAFFGFFLLTIFLDKAEVGLFFAISELVAILGYFSDVGLAAAIIQKKEAPTTQDIRSTFTIQQVLVISLVGLVFLFTPWLKDFYQITQDGIYLLWALIISFFLASLKTIPSVLLERKLKFDLLVVVEVIENLLFYGIAVVLAWKGFGVISYTWAVLVRSIVGAVLIYFLSPWPIGFAFQKESLKHLLKFGVPYQANTFLAVIKDRLMNIFLWRIIGATGVGILGWAQKWAQMPLRFIMDSVIKVTFPAYARMQDEKEQLSISIEKTLFFVSLLVFPLLVGMVILAQPLITIIPRYGKWQVALLALSLYAFNSLWGAITTPLTNALTAVGKIKVVFRLMIMWTVLTWILFPALAIKFGYNGVALASALVSVSSVIAIISVKKYIHFRLLPAIFHPVFASLLMGIFLLVFKRFLAVNLIGVFSLVLFGAVIYFAAIYLMEGKKLLADTKEIINVFKRS